MRVTVAVAGAHSMILYLRIESGDDGTAFPRATIWLDVRGPRLERKQPSLRKTLRARACAPAPLRGKDHSSAVVSPSRFLVRAGAGPGQSASVVLPRGANVGVQRHDPSMPPPCGGRWLGRTLAPHRRHSRGFCAEGPATRLRPVHLNVNATREVKWRRLAPMEPAGWPACAQRIASRHLAVPIERGTGQTAMAPRLVAREGEGRGGNHRVVSSSELGRRASVPNSRNVEAHSGRGFIRFIG